MSKYYIITLGEVLADTHCIGELEDIDAAKKAAFDDMGDGDILAGFSGDGLAKAEDAFGVWELYASTAKEIVEEYADDSATLKEHDGSIEDIPYGLWFWEDGDCYDVDFFNTDGTLWDGESEPY